MGRLLRDPGTNAVIGLSAVAAAFCAIALAVYTADPARSHAWAFFLALALAVFFAFGAALALLYVVVDTTIRASKVKKVRALLSEGQGLWGEMLAAQEWADEMGERARTWTNVVQTWINDNLPNHTFDFGSSDDTDKLLAGSASGQSGSYARFMDRRLSDLRELLRDLRS